MFILVLVILAILVFVILGQSIILMTVVINIKRRELKQMIQLDHTYTTPMQSVLQEYQYGEE